MKKRPLPYPPFIWCCVNPSPPVSALDGKIKVHTARLIDEHGSEVGRYARKEFRPIFTMLDIGGGDRPYPEQIHFHFTGWAYDVSDGPVFVYQKEKD